MSTIFSKVYKHQQKKKNIFKFFFPFNETEQKSNIVTCIYNVK